MAGGRDGDGMTQSLRHPLQYRMHHQLPSGGSEWLITHGFKSDAAPAPVMFDKYANRYSFTKFFPYAGLSGWHWVVYHNVAFGPVPEDAGTE